MSQFHGYTVEIIGNEGSGQTFKGTIKDALPDQVVLENATILNKSGSFEKLEPNQITIEASKIKDLKVVGLPKQKEGNRNGSSKKKKKNKKDKDKKGNFDVEECLDELSKPLELETKYVDIYNEKPQNVKDRNTKKKDNQLQEFDFKSNLEKFDKESVFKDIQMHDNTDNVDRLVSFNKVDNRNNDKYANDEMILKIRNDEKKSNIWDDDSNTYGYSNIVKPKLTSSCNSSTSNVSDVPNNRKGYKGSNNSTVNGNDTNSGSNMLQFFSSKYDETPVPTCSTLQLSEIFNICKTKFELTDDILIENAGRSICELIINNIIGPFRVGFKNHNDPPVVLLLVGNNRAGAIALSAGRYMINRGLRTIAFVLYDEEEINENMDIELKRYSTIGGKLVKNLKQMKELLDNVDAPLEFVLDGLQGYDGDVQDMLETVQQTVRDLTQWLNRLSVAVMSIDIPVGVNSSSGTCEDGNLLLRSRYVVSVGVPLAACLNLYKFGHFARGELSHFVADCGIPRRAFAARGSLRRFDRRWFAEGGYVDLTVV